MDWQPERGILEVRIIKNSKISTTKIPINPPENTVYIRTPIEDENGNEIADIHSLVGPEDEFWLTAFCIGDKVRLTSDSFNISRTKIGEILEVKYIQKTNKTLCTE